MEQLQAQVRLGEEWLDGSTAGRDLGVQVAECLAWTSSTLAVKRANCILGYGKESTASWSK